MYDGWDSFVDSNGGVERVLLAGLRMLLFRRIYSISKGGTVPHSADVEVYIVG